MPRLLQGCFASLRHWQSFPCGKPIKYHLKEPWNVNQLYIVGWETKKVAVFICQLAGVVAVVVAAGGSELLPWFQLSLYYPALPSPTHLQDHVGKQLCPSLSLAEREVMAWHLKPQAAGYVFWHVSICLSFLATTTSRSWQVPVHCIWMSDTGSGSRLRMWSSTASLAHSAQCHWSVQLCQWQVAALYPLPRPRLDLKFWV